MTVMDAKKMHAPDKTRAAINELARLTMPDVIPRNYLGALGVMTGKHVRIARAMGKYNTGALEDAVRGGRTGVVVGKTGSGKTSAHLHHALALYTLGQLEPTGKTTVAVESEAPVVRPRRKASPKAVALLERFKSVPSVDPHRFREDVDKVLDTSL